MSESTKVWLDRFKEQQSSGLSVDKYCRKKGIQPSRWYYWRKKLKSAQSPSRNKFVPVVTSGHSSLPEKMFAIEFHNGTRMIFPESVNEDRLARILAGVKRGMS